MAFFVTVPASDLGEILNLAWPLALILARLLISPVVLEIVGGLPSGLALVSCCKRLNFVAYT